MGRRALAALRLFLTPVNTVDLDSAEAYRSVTGDDMITHIVNFPGQVLAAWESVQGRQLPTRFYNVDQIVICGVGGSSISGQLLTALVEKECRIPVLVNRGYALPRHVDSNKTLVVALSQSGETEETVSAVEQAIESEAHVLAIVGGGQLASMVEEVGGALWLYDYPSHTRAALGWQYGLLLGLFARLDLVDRLPEMVQGAITQMHRNRKVLNTHTPTNDNPAKQMANLLAFRIPITLGSGILAPVAERWKTQFNENAKTAAYFETLPEFNHNAIVGLEYPRYLKTSVAILDIVSLQYDHPRVVLRHQITCEVLEEKGFLVRQFAADGDSPLGQQLSMVQLGDFASFYLAVKHGVMPTPISGIHLFKDRLSLGSD